MSKYLHKDGTVDFTIAASDKLAIYSRDNVKVYTRPVGVEIPTGWSFLAHVAPNTEYLSAAFAASVNVRIEADFAPVYYATGTAPVISERRSLRGQGTPGVLDSTGTLTAAMIGSGIITSAAAAVTATVDTGTIMDAAVDMEIGDSIDWSVIKVGASAFTVTASTGHTLVGTGVVGTGTAGSFRTRKTAANTFVTYRLG